MISRQPLSANRFPAKPRGFSLVELLVVIAIVSIMAALAASTLPARPATQLTQAGETLSGLATLGQLAEIQGIGDQGEAGESIIRGVASLATPRGSVFSIYSKAQAIDVVNGRAIANGEKMVRAMIERYFDGDDVRFRVIHWSQIYP